MTCRTEGGVTYKQTFNAENRLATVQKLISGTCVTPAGISMQWDFAYDGDGTRVKQIVSTYDQTTQSITGIAITACFTLLRGALGGAYEVTTDANNVALSTKKYYSIAGMTVAMNDGSGLQYLLTDHLGSVVAVTDANGTLTSQQRYLPFGQTRTDLNGPRITNTDFGYTGQRNLDSLGLMDYHARFYDAALMRWTQPDSITPGGPQGLNRFSYVNNDPTILTDPSGHCIDAGDAPPGSASNHNLCPPRKQSESGGGGTCQSSYCDPRYPKIKNEIEGHLKQCESTYEASGCSSSSQPVINQPTISSTGPSSKSPLDDYFEYLRYANKMFNVLGIIEAGIQYGRPIYKQVKYAASLGPLEIGIDMAVQLYDDRNKDLNIPQRATRTFIRGIESGTIDLASQAVGGASATGLQIGVPVPFVSAGVGYIIGAYTTSNILTNTANNNVNPWLFSHMGLGGP